MTLDLDHAVYLQRVEVGTNFYIVCMIVFNNSTECVSVTYSYYTLFESIPVMANTEHVFVCLELIGSWKEMSYEML